ncbi:hypothetical protein H8356DRAFT_1325211 [Neocallimastix lanati (nom. inval.)]|nr:hypothetical protein H8356DRAFT_1325211 [Neocallimastix sp. JGI-2020a]
MNIQQVINKLPILEQYGSERKFTFLKGAIKYWNFINMRINNKETLVSFNNKYNRLFDDMGEDHKTLITVHKNCKTIKEAMETIEQAERIEKQLKMINNIEYNCLVNVTIEIKTGILKTIKGILKTKKNQFSNVVNKLGKDNYNIHDNENKNNLYNERTAWGNSNFKFNNCYKNNLFGKNYNYPNKQKSNILYASCSLFLNIAKEVVINSCNKYLIT